MTELFSVLFRDFWIVVIIGLVATAVFWRLEARDRIKVDPSLRKPLNRLYTGFVFWTSLPFLVMGAGIISGHVDNILFYLRFDSDNIFIVICYILMFSEDALFLYWIFLRRGDHLLVLHTEIVRDRPKLRVAVRILAITLPFVHGFTLYQATFSPHFGQFFDAMGA